jgi:hypothetical protein
MSLFGAIISLLLTGTTQPSRGVGKPEKRTAPEQYAINEKNRLEELIIIEEALPKNLGESNFSLAASNYGRMAHRHADLGLLHWRHGLDPRPDFERGIEAYEKMCALAREHALPKNVGELPVVYAMLFLMGRQTAIEFEDENYHKQHRWPCYECCLVHMLHDQPLNELHRGLLDRYLAKYDQRADRVILTYLQLLGARPSEQSRDELVKVADGNWVRRRGNQFFDGWAWWGYGIMNDIYVDIYLAAVLKKIGWQGDSVHRWKWENP